MRFVNRHGAPKTLLNLAQRHKYSKGRADLSVTEMIDAPRISRLRKRHWNDIEIDVSENLFMLLGTALHQVAEAGADAEHLSEERLFAEISGWTISGAIDVQKVGENEVVIGDYKTTSAWAVMRERPSWEEQLNCYAWLVRHCKGWKVVRLEIYAVIRDWRKILANQKNDYPLRPIMTLPVKLWSEADQEAFIRQRITLHQEAELYEDLDQPLPDCKDGERWYNERTKNFTRCADNYCGVRDFCDQYRREQRSPADQGADRRVDGDARSGQDPD